LPACLTLIAASVAVAATPVEKLVPDTTRGFFSIPDFREVQVAFEKTEFGKLTKLDAMKPFFDDMEAQINEQLNNTGVRLGIDWRQIADVVSGEVALAVIEPQKHKQRHAVALIADVTGKATEVNKLLDSVAARMQKRGANRKQETVRGTTLISYAVPPQKRVQRGFDVAIFVHRYEDANGAKVEQLFAVDHDGVARELLEQAQSRVDAGTLSEVNAFQQTMARCAREAAGLVPQIRWYIEPMGYARVTRESIPNRKPRRNDVLGAFEKQGFTALEGVGGFANLSTDRHDLLVRAMIYAPGDPKLEDRFQLAARILNGAKTVPADIQDWVPSNVSGYHTVSWDITKSFSYVDTLVDEIAGGETGFFDDLKASLEEDPNGPRINIDEEIVDHFGDRITLISDTTLPITPESERLLLAISLKNPQQMARGIFKIMENDPTAEKHIIGDIPVWVIISDKEEDIPGLDIEGGGLDSFGLDAEAQDEDEDEDPLLAISNTAICVSEGHLLVASDISFISEIIQRTPVQKSPLENAADYQVIQAELTALNQNNAECLRSFTRADDAVQATFELFKQGRLPESKGIVGRVLNRILAPQEKGELRKQRFDAQKLPDFKVVRQYLGPAGASIQLDPDGWVCTLIALKPQGKDDVAGATVSTASASSEAR
jgi:hypothetical protein